MNEHARNNKYFAAAKEFRRSLNHFFDDILLTIGARVSRLSTWSIVQGYEKNLVQCIYTLRQ